MTLLYRGIWRDDRSDLIPSITGQFRDWLPTKAIEIDVPDEGVVEGSYPNGKFEVVVRRAALEETRATQVKLSEERPGTGELWTTRLTGIEAPGGEQWVWVDLERVADDSSERPQWAAPRLVRELIDAGEDVRVDQVRLTTKAHQVDAKGLHGLIKNEERSLPLVVFSEDLAGGLALTRERADSAARMLAGAIQVMVLPQPDVDVFKATEEGLAVWGGAARLYLPNTGPGGLRPERHRYISKAQMGDDPRRPARILANLVAGIASARRPPRVYEIVRKELRFGRSSTDAELLAYADAEITRLTRERDELSDKVEQIEETLFDTQVDLEEAVKDAARAKDEFQKSLLARDDPGAVDSISRLAIESSSIADALDRARDLLTRVVIPPGVEHDIDDLDSHECGAAWASLIWSGLRAMHVYAEAGFDGNFWNWCRASGHLWAWPASEKKLAMTESETVQNNDRLREQRRLPVSTDVDRSGKVLMYAHLKIAEGGGDLAPRVYFHDDTRGPTGRVHVGFVGPHRYMENRKS